MKRKICSNGIPLRAAINLTPIIDVALVLVIILLITAPMLALADIDVTLPAAVTRDAEDEVKINITLSRERFGQTLGALLSSGDNKDVLVVLRADTDVPYSSIQAILGEARAVGARRLAIATLQRGGGE